MHIILICLTFAFCTITLAAKSILVVGGAGFIGSHVNKKLVESGYQTIILDNLSTGDLRNIHDGLFIKGDIADTKLLDSIFTTHHIDAVMHFAGLLDVGESVKDPLMYYKNNVVGTINLLDAMQRHDVRIFVFSSSASIFGIPNCPLVDEDHPCNPLNPYGRSKWIVETILKDLDQLRGLRYCALRYFNVAGGDPEGILKNYRTKNFNLVSLILKSLTDPKASITIFGNDYPTFDGTCIRDFIHVEDLAVAHLAAMENLLNGAPSTSYNLGTGRGYSVREVIRAAETVTGLHVNTINGNRRLGDPPVAIANSKKAAEELNWRPQHSSLDSIIQDSWLAMTIASPDSPFANVYKSQKQSDRLSLYTLHKDEDSDNLCNQIHQRH